MKQMSEYCPDDVRFGQMDCSDDTSIICPAISLFYRGYIRDLNLDASYRIIKEEFQKVASNIKLDAAHSMPFEPKKSEGAYKVFKKYTDVDLISTDHYMRTSCSILPETQFFKMQLSGIDFVEYSNKTIVLHLKDE